MLFQDVGEGPLEKNIPLSYAKFRDVKSKQPVKEAFGKGTSRTEKERENIWDVFRQPKFYLSLCASSTAKV